jgi:hypothetical protein
MKILLLITMMFLSSLNFKDAPLKDVIDTYGEPSFEYRYSIDDTTIPMDFGVFGWKNNDSYYGAQTKNDTITTFVHFKDSLEYHNFITKD